MQHNRMNVTTRGDREIVITRQFDAPPALVYKAMTDPQLIPRWWGPRRFATIVDTLDPRPGGRWRFINRDQDGTEFGFNGEFRELDPPRRIVQTFEFEGMPGHISVETATLTEQDGGTLLTVVSVFDSPQDRDGMLQSGMEEGASETYERLDEILAELATR
jgi:uncharacterized protein YndB with AHSA1/START domain